MKKLLLSSFLLLSILMMISCGEDDPIVTPPEEEMGPECGTELYRTALFDSIEVSTVKYGENLSFNGQVNLNLMMDIYTPAMDDNTERPVIIWAFGGSFIGGNRAQMESNCRLFAERGFVTAAIDYRLVPLVDLIPLGGLDSVTALNVAVKAMGDMKASIRHMRKEAANGNPYGINPDKIYVGGLSSGGITALGVGVLTEEDLVGMEPHIVEIIDENGGLEGNSGDAENLSYSSAVSGVINLAGAIYRLNWLDPGDPPIMSMHGTADETVPYDYGWVNVSGMDVIPLFGSGAFHPYLDQIGSDNVLQTVDGGGHTDIFTDDVYSGDRDPFFNQKIIDLIQEELCN